MMRSGYPFLVSLLVLAVAPGAAAQEPQPAHVEIREFLIGGLTPVGALPGPPPQVADAERCDVHCEVPTLGLAIVTIDVRGPEGFPFQYKYERRGCWWFSTPAAPEQEEPAGQPEGPRDGMGRKVIDVRGCTSLLVRPATIHLVADPWTCTHNPPFLEPWVIDLPDRKLVPDVITIPFSNPLPSDLPSPLAGEDEEPAMEYRTFAECTRVHCLGVERPHPCLPDYYLQVTGTVRLEW